MSGYLLGFLRHYQWRNLNLLAMIRDVPRRNGSPFGGYFALKNPTGKSNLRNMNRQFTAVIKEDDGWWIGWVAEIPGVNSQGKTRVELLKNLRSGFQTHS
jgi:hypothetical protein